MKSAEERKQQSIALLKEQGVPYIEHLPVIENADEVRLRSAEEIARRAICCLKMCIRDRICPAPCRLSS